MRLNKFLSDAGIASRRKSEEFILQGRVAVNGNTVRDLSVRIDPERDVVSCDGELIRQNKKVYLLLNKPKGYVTTTSDERKRPKVTDLIPRRFNLYPVGRLDFNTTGLLLLTNDGDFANYMMHPSHKFERVYSVLLDRNLSEKDKIKFLNGIYLDNRKSRFTNISFPSKNNARRVSVVTEEGRNRFVKRMFAALGYHVQSLERTKFGPFELKDLAAGKYKKIDDKTIEQIKNSFENKND